MHAQTSSADDNRLLRSIPATRVALIERIALAAARSAGRSVGRSVGKGRAEMQQRFLRTYFRGVGEEDLMERAPTLLANAALDHLEFGSRRAPGQSLVRVFNPDPQKD